MPARVLWVIKGLGPGGAERLLCAAARAHDRSRFDIACAFVLPYKDHLAEELEQAGVRTYCMSRTRTDLRWPSRLMNLIRDCEWDIVHVHSPLPGSVARLAVLTMPRADRPRLVSTEHNQWSTHRGPTRALNAVTSRFDDVTFTVTDEVRRSMCGPVAKRAETLQHGIDVASVAAAAAHRGRIRNELGIGSDELVVGTVANFRPQKDYPNLLQAARLLADRDVPVRLVAVGQGPQESETCELRNELGLQERVILTGFRNDATSVMGACDVFTLASRWEGLPVALMEALALGLPVVATDVGGVGEELVDGKTALLVPPSDAASLAHAIERVVTAPELREALARAASERAVDFDVVSAVARIEAAYAALAPEAAATSPEPVIPRRRRPLPKGLDIRDATPDDRPAILELCRASLGWGDDSRFDELFSWKHDQNAFGPSYMWVATDGGKVVGLRAFMRWEFVRDDEVLRAVRAVDTATHPDYQGRGLFTAMTLHGLDVVKDDGVAFVFNTPNDKSRPGYLKMGWKEVGRLPVGIRLASPMAAWTVVRSRTGASHWPEPLHLGDPVAEKLDGDLGGPTGRTGVRSVCTNRTTEFVRWRYGSAVLGYRAIPYSGDGVAIVRCRRRGQSRELVLLDSFGERPPSPRSIDDWLQSSRATHALRLGRYGSTAGFAPYPAGGPLLTWREANSMAPPPAINWALVMGDVELF